MAQNDFTITNPIWYRGPLDQKEGNQDSNGLSEPSSDEKVVRFNGYSFNDFSMYKSGKY